MLFVWTSQFCGIYLAYTLPFTTNKQNFLEIFNEFMVFALGVCSMVLLGMGHTIPQKIQQAKFFTQMVYIKLGLNTLLIVRSLCL
jgi:hypothetical protein